MGDGEEKKKSGKMGGGLLFGQPDGREGGKRRKKFRKRKGRILFLFAALQIERKKNSGKGGRGKGRVAPNKWSYIFTTDFGPVEKGKKKKKYKKKKREA